MDNRRSKDEELYGTINDFNFNSELYIESQQFTVVFQNAVSDILSNLRHYHEQLEGVCWHF